MKYDYLIVGAGLFGSVFAHEAKKKGISIDFEKLEYLLGVPVVGTTARNPKTLKHLTDVIYQNCISTFSSSPKQIQYIPIIEDCILMLSPVVSSMLEKERQYLTRWICLKLLDGEKTIYLLLKNI